MNCSSQLADETQIYLEHQDADQEASDCITISFAWKTVTDIDQTEK